MAKNVKKLPAASEKELAGLVTTRESLIETMMTNKAAYDTYKAAEDQLKKTDKSILSVLIELKKKIVKVLGFILTLIDDPPPEGRVTIGVNELQAGLAKKGYQKELDLVEDVIKELKEEKEAKNKEENEGKRIYSFSIAKDEQRAAG